MKNRLSVKCISVMLCSVLLLGMVFQTIPAEELSQQGIEEDGGILVDEDPVEESADENPVEELIDEEPVEELIDEEPVEVFVDHEPIEGMVDEEPAIFTYDPENEGTGEFSDLTKRSGDIDADITGTYYTLSAETILNKLNAIRKEAYQEGLTSKYVPLKWSAVIESAARKRAMEAGITMNHRDLNDGSISQYMGYKTSFYGWAEDLAWNNTHNADGILVGIDQFYEEKEEYLKERAGKEHGVTGHYTSIINPDFQYVGVSGCQMNGTPNNWFTVAMQLGSSPQGTISQTKDPSNGVITNTLKVGAKYVSSFSVSGPAQMSEEETQGYDITGKIAYPTKGTYGTVTEDFSITYGQERGVTWTSSQPSVASVSNGVVTAHQAGNATITAKIGTKTVTKEITVNPGVPTVQAVNLDKNSYRLFTTQSSIQVTATIDPANVEQKTVVFRSSDPNTFTVSKGDGAGSAEVSVDAVDGVARIKLNRVTSANKNAKLTVMVDGTSVRKEANVAIIVPTSDFSIIQDGTDASFAGKTWEASIGESTAFTCKVVPENAYDKKITWKSSNEGIAKISSKGDSGAVVTCMGTGQATITCTSENAPEKIIRTFTVKGGIKATSVSLNRKSLTLYKGQTYQLSAMVLPEGLEAVITYKSDKESVAKVSANGLVTAVGEGVAKITASSGTLAPDSCSVTVKSGEISAGDSPYATDNSGRIWVADNSIDKELPYTGKAVLQTHLRVYFGNRLLQENTDYTISYKNNVKAAKATDNVHPTFTVKLKGQYQGSRNYPFTIKPIDLADTSQVVEYGRLVVLGNGKAQKPVPELYYGSTKLKEKKDFVCTYDPADDYTSTDQDHKIFVRGIGNFASNTTREILFRISDKEHSLSKASITIKPADPAVKKILFKGEIKAEDLKVTVKLGKNVLPADYYRITSVPDTVGKGNVTVEATDAGKAHSYVGYKLVPITSYGDRAMKDVTVEDLKKSVSFSYKELSEKGGIHQTPTLKYHGEVLTEGVDYQVSYKNHQKVGNAKIIYTGLGRYSGKLNCSYRVIAYVGNYTLEYPDSVSFIKGGVTPPVTVTDADGYVLNPKTDYSISIQDRSNQAPGTLTFSVFGKGNHIVLRRRNLTMQITSASLRDASMVLTDKQYVSSGTGWQSTVTVTDRAGKALKAGKDYDKNILYSYAGMTPDGVPAAGSTVYVTVTGINDYAGSSLTAGYRVYSKNISSLVFTIDKMVYTGQELEPKPGVQIHAYPSSKDAKAKTNEIDPTGVYKVTGYSANLSSGTGKVTIRGLGEYGATKVYSFSITKQPY